MKKNTDKLNTIIFIVLAIIVAAGWIFGLTSAGSELNQAFRKAPLHMNILGALWFLAGSFVTFMYGTERWTVKSIAFNTVPVIISIALTIVGAIVIAANGFINI